MKIVNFIGIILVFFIQSTICEQNDSGSDDKLIFAHILFRHGDRNIGRSYPNDPWENEEKYWPEGYGQLTAIGKRRQFELGTYLRKRYFNLLPTNGTYHPNNIVVFSSDYDRAIQSAAYAMSGMFPEQNMQSENGLMLKQLVPIHSIPRNMDYILCFEYPCSLYDTSYDEPMSLEQKRMFKTTAEYLEVHTGSKIRNTEDIRKIHKTLWIEQLKNLPLPSWTKEIFYPGSDMEKLATLRLKYLANTKALARLRIGFLFREMLEHFSMKINSTLVPDRSLWVYSGHDFVVVSLLNALGLFEPIHMPNYSSCIFIELHESNTGFHVEIYYKQHLGDDIDTLEPLFIPNCGKKCPLNKMYELYEDILPTGDIDTECRNNGATKGFHPNNSNAYHLSNTQMIAIVLMSLLNHLPFLS